LKTYNQGVKNRLVGWGGNRKTGGSRKQRKGGNKRSVGSKAGQLRSVYMEDGILFETVVGENSKLKDTNWQTKENCRQKKTQGKGGHGLRRGGMRPCKYEKE